MNTHDVLGYGHRTILQAIDGLDPAVAEQSGACGTWSIKDILAHLASYEHMLVDVVTDIEGGEETPVLDRLRAPSSDFNDAEVDRRRGMSFQEVLDEYETACVAARERVATLPDAVVTTNGIMPWYGEAYDLDDFLVYAFYGHKREHAAQIAAFRDRPG